MTRLTVIAALLAGCGSTLVFGELRWFRVMSIPNRVSPYRVGLGRAPFASPALPAAPIRGVIGPLLVSAASRVASAAGANDSLALRLQRSGATLDPLEFRLRQGALALTIGVVAAGASSTIAAPPVARLGIIVAVPVAVILGSERWISQRSEQWQERFLHELPTISEQLGLLMGAGYSLTAAMARVAARTTGECSREFSRVQARVAQGAGEPEALRESSEFVGIDSYRRLVAVLTLNREAADLGTLITNEAQHIRHLVHRQQMELLEERGQQVWIPVTVATLVPGVIFLAVPFVDAMSQLSS